MKSSVRICCSGLSRDGVSLRLLLLSFFVSCVGLLYAQQVKVLSASELKRLSMEELINVEVTSVSRMPQKLTEVASAVQVISGADIHRSGATNVPDALRLLTNLQVAQLSASAWIISARGFNTIFANKLLVMIDGRSIYTPLFGGVIWELQNVVLEDIDRIEVISGPGGTLWGANAVNGVINIITKKAQDTQGTYIAATAGTFVKDMAEVRHGGRIGPKLFYRVYGLHFDRAPTIRPNGEDNTDAWRMSQAGFRLDWSSTPVNNFTVQGDFYNGRRRTQGFPSDNNGQNILARWRHTFSPRSSMALQVYYDRYFRDDIPSNASDEMKTYDVDFQLSFPVRKKHRFLTGIAYRLAKDHAQFLTPLVGILPPKKDLVRYSGFIQDEITLTDSLRLTLGTKVQQHFYAGFDLQPSARLAWTFRNKSTIWSAVSRAIRTASRFDVDYFIPVTPQPPTVASVAGGPNFVSETLVAYELGYRLQPTAFTSFSVAAFYNVYGDVYSVEALPGTLTYQIQNGSEGTTWGVELSGSGKVSNQWRWRAGYTYFEKNLYAKPGHNFNPDYLGNDAKNQFMFHSIFDISRKWHFDVTARYLDYLPQTLATARVKGYVEMDARMSLDLKPFEISLVGQNLLQNRHTEFGTLAIPRSMYAKIACRF